MLNNASPSSQSSTFALCQQRKWPGSFPATEKWFLSWWSLGLSAWKVHQQQRSHLEDTRLPHPWTTIGCSSQCSPGKWTATLFSARESPAAAAGTSKNHLDGISVQVWSICKDHFLLRCSLLLCLLHRVFVNVGVLVKLPEILHNAKSLALFLWNAENGWVIELV